MWLHTYFAYKYDEKQKPWAATNGISRNWPKKSWPRFSICIIEVCVRLLWKSLVLFWWITLIKAGDVPKCLCMSMFPSPSLTMMSQPCSSLGHRLGNQVLFKLSSPWRKNNSLQPLSRFNNSQTLEINLQIFNVFLFFRTLSPNVRYQIT